MVTDSNRIKVKSIEFSNPPFRKLGNIKIEFSDRLTLIAGHNGIGKTTILGLIANSFGIAKGGPKSYFDELFFRNIEQIIYIAQSEVPIAQENPSSAPIVEADVLGKIVKKRCSMTHRSEWERARIVPRTINRDEGDLVGPDAKIPLPTIYLGVKRLAPVGEADEKEVVSRKLTMDADDIALMMEFLRKIIIGVKVNNNITHQSIKGSKKKTAQPGYANHDALAISLGQDSLGSIATALASFNRLKRELGNDYKGGLLVIDELDVGFHPHAIERLANALKAYARKLNLQIIATTHSPRLIEVIHPDGDGHKRSPDSVIYIVDTQKPRLAENQSLSAILADMALRESEDVNVKPIKPTLHIYFEDAEGLQFFEAVLPRKLRSRISRENGIKIKLIALEVGGSNLVKLPSKDTIFRNRIIIVDADTSVPTKTAIHGNIVKLPCVKGARGTERSPENTIKKFLRQVSNAQNGIFYQALLNFKVINPSSDRINNTFLRDDSGVADDRETNKIWWQSHSNSLKKWGVIEQWAICHKADVDKFHESFYSAISAVANRLTRSGNH